MEKEMSKKTSAIFLIAACVITGDGASTNAVLTLRDVVQLNARADCCSSIVLQIGPPAEDDGRALLARTFADQGESCSNKPKIEALRSLSIAKNIIKIVHLLQQGREPRDGLNRPGETTGPYAMFATPDDSVWFDDTNRALHFAQPWNYGLIDTRDWCTTPNTLGDTLVIALTACGDTVDAMSTRPDQVNSREAWHHELRRCLRNAAPTRVHRTRALLRRAGVVV
jgi:hypothetical protein